MCTYFIHLAKEAAYETLILKCKAKVRLFSMPRFDGSRQWREPPGGFSNLSSDVTVKKFPV